MNKATIATGGAFGASLLSALAASCCVAPALFVAFGLSATLVTPLTYLEPYRPYFTAVGALCLATAGWWLYRRPAVCTSGACVAPTQRRTRLFFWLSVGGFFTATFYPYVRQQLITMELISTIICPYCGATHTETMPTDQCQYFYECPTCGTILRPKAGDCCVFCSYGTAKCPSKQADSRPAQT